MHEILEKYKERLINLSGKNRSLVSLKLPKKRAFDITTLCEFYENKADEVVDYIISREEKRLKILEDNIDKNQIFLEYNERLKGINQEINYIYKETGRFELYIGYPFVEGKLKDDTFVKAPLVLFPVTIINEGDKWYIQNNIGGGIILNKVLLLAIGKHNNVKVDTINTVYDDVVNNFIGIIIEELESKGIYINLQERKLEKFNEYKKEETEKFEAGKLNIVYNAILGQYPIANSIYNDYEDMISQKITTPLLEDLLKTNTIKRTLSLEEEEHGKLEFSEDDLYLFSPLDYSQEQAVIMHNKTDRVVIYGPPGTGKSETIANIIVDALAKDKKVLMVSQKRSALDIIFSRLDILNSKSMLIHDINKDKKNFYQGISQVIDIIEKPKDFYSAKIHNSSKKIDEKILCLETIAKVLHKKRRCGLTLYEMYSNCNAINNREDLRYTEFKRFREKNKFKNNQYNEVLEEAKHISEKHIQYFNIYKDLKEKNEFIDYINLNLNIMEIDEYSENLKKNINSFKILTDKANTNMEMYRGLLDVYDGGGHKLTDEQLHDFARKFNKEKHGNLLDIIDSGKWWSIRYWRTYYKNKKQEDENFKEFLDKQENNISNAKEMYQVIHSQSEVMKEIKSIINEEAYKNIVNKMIEGKDLTEEFNKIIHVLKILDEYKEILKEVRGFSHLRKKILEYANDENLVCIKKRIDELPEFIILYNILEVEKGQEVQWTINYIESYDEFVEEVIKEMKDKREDVKEFILNRWNSKILHLGDYNRSYKEFKRQANKKRGYLSIRKYMEQFGELVLELYPCFLVSPETVSEIFPLQEGLFDVIIFDEASQMFIENSLPAIYRGKQVIIVGDNKQLRPNRIFSNRYIDEDGEDDSIAAMEEESLLDLAKINYNTVRLTYHYRSKYKELINFSNYAFYGGTLKISPNTRINSDEGLPIERVLVSGKWIGRQNIEEAQNVVKILGELFRQRKNNETIGIITFNINQKQCIEDEINTVIGKDIEFKNYYTHEIEREEKNEDKSLFIKNIENVQGDERDIIIFSIGYAPNEKGEILTNFGSLSFEGGENRLNVAITRAKKKIYVVTSIEPERLEVENTKNNGAKLFKKYLQYVRAVSNCDNREVIEILESLVIRSSKIQPNTIEDKFKKELSNLLIHRGYIVHENIGDFGYEMDIAIYDKDKAAYILGIDCDGKLYDTSCSARERDIHRQRYLESKGWKIVRVWSKQWYTDKESVIKKIEKAIEKVSNEKCINE